MAGQQGVLILLKRSNGDDPETFTGILAMRAKTLELDGEGVTTTASDSVDSNGKLWREKMAGGVNAVNFSGGMVLKDRADEKALVALKMSNNPVDNFQVVLPGLGTFQGAFHLDSMSITGDLENEITGDIALSSAGVPSFTAET